MGIAVTAGKVTAGRLGLLQGGLRGRRDRSRELHPSMGNPADHAFGLELELIELQEQRERARVQGREVDAAGLQRAIDGVKLELARTNEALKSAPARPLLRADHPRSA